MVGLEKKVSSSFLVFFNTTLKILASPHQHMSFMWCWGGTCRLGKPRQVQELSACILGWQPKKPNHLYKDGILRPSLLTSKDGRKLNFRLLYQVPVAYNAYPVPPLQRPLTTGFREGRMHCCAGWAVSLERTWRLCVTCPIPDTKYLFICFSLKFLPS